ncbi:hypothetical protein RB653_001562 [Dictyostelium firmibasis]|uniref:Uncharacterized protein n=1 Tax=Dictyostelium firmibasis TaxID=79012 RepID=A0AAN7YYS9_9MYCE
MELPLIVIKKIILNLIRYKIKNISQFIFLSKSIQSFIFKQINELKFKDIKSFEQFSKDSKSEIIDQITKIKIENDLVKNYKEEFFNSTMKKNFKSLETIYINYNRPSKSDTFLIQNILKSNDFEIKFKSNISCPNLFNQAEFAFNRLKKLKLPNMTISINVANQLFKKPNLESIDIAISTYFYMYSNWLDGDDENEMREAELGYKNSINEFKELVSSNSKIKTLSIRDLSYKNLYVRYSRERFATENYILFTESIISILSSPFQNISKFCLYGIYLPNELSIFDSLSTTKIKKLKLEYVNGLEKDWLNFINYCQKNQSLKQLSIKSNSIKDKDNLLCNLVLKNHTSLSKLNISYNYFNLEIIIETILKKYNQYNKLNISDSNILPFDSLLSNTDRLLSYYDVGGNSHLCIKYTYGSKGEKVILSSSIVQDFKKSFYSIILPDLFDIEIN